MVKCIPPLPVKKSKRLKNKKYVFKDRIVYWSGKKINCEHNTFRTNCVKCDGSNICKHKRRRNRCKECGGKSICSHGVVRYKCKTCDGDGICPHKKRKNTCLDCNGSSMCHHKKLRYRCRLCKGRGICPHDRYFSRCKDCKGASICTHGRIKHTCKDCGGKGVCPHQKRINQCPECCPDELQYKRFCHICGNTSVKRKYGTPGICAKCDETVSERIEHRVKKYILCQLPPASVNDSQLTGSGCGEARRRADLLWIGQDRVVQVEIDEDEHKYRLVECELGKMDSSKWGLHKDVQCKPMCFIRFNPDGCKTDEEFNLRCDHLVRTIQQCLEGWEGPMTDNLKTRVVYMYYSENSKHIRAASSQEQFIVDVI